MKKTILLLLLSIFCSLPQQNIFAKKKIKEVKKVNVLIIGYDLTYYIETFEILKQMIDTNRFIVSIEKIIIPGMSLSGHLNNIITSKEETGILTRKKLPNELTETEKKIKKREWDFVILQDGKFQFLIPEVVTSHVHPAIQQVKELIKNPNCKILLLNTWPSEPVYPKQYCFPSSLIDKSIEKDEYCSQQIKNFEQEFEIINETLNQIAQKNSIGKTSEGDKFYEILKVYPKIKLYEDNMFLNQHGTFINACIFFQIFTGETANSNKYYGKFDKKLAKSLKKIAAYNLSSELGQRIRLPETWK